MSQSIDYRGLEAFEKDLRELLNEIPRARRELHEEYAAMAKSEVDKQMRARLNITGRSGHDVIGWQEPRVGTGGGYAAVSAKTGRTGKNSEGAITNYLESGHKIRSPSGTAKRRQKRRVKVAGRVDGRHFYDAASTAAKSKAIDIAEKFVEKMRRKLEGK